MTECIAFETLKKDIKISHHFYINGKIYNIDNSMQYNIILPEPFIQLLEEKIDRNSDLYIIPFTYGKLETDTRIIHTIAICHPSDNFKLIHGKETIEGRIRCYFDGRYFPWTPAKESDYYIYFNKHTILVEIKISK